MIIEHFKDVAEIGKRFRTKGRMMPEGLKYIDSWVEPNNDRCFQLMECNDASLFQQWTPNWDDLVDFEIVLVVPSKEALSTSKS